MVKEKSYIKRVGIAIDQLINVVFFNGDEDETLSSRMGKRVLRGDCKVCYVICRFLDIFDKDHCYKSIEHDEGVKIDGTNGK